LAGLTHHWHQRPLLLGSLLLSLSGGFERATPKSLACTQATGLLLLPGQLLMCVHLLLQLLMCAHLVLCSCVHIWFCAHVCTFVIAAGILHLHICYCSCSCVYFCYCNRNLTPSHLLLQLLMCVFCYCSRNLTPSKLYGGYVNMVLFRLHREMHRALSLLPKRTQQLRETGETGEN